MPRIVHIAIKVDDLEKATKFYEEVFGFRQTSTGYARGHVSRHLTDGNIDLALMVYDSEDVEEAQLSGPGPCIHHWGIEVEDRDSYVAKIEANGGTIISEPGEGALKFRAPDGTVAEIVGAGRYNKKKGKKGARGPTPPKTRGPFGPGTNPAMPPGFPDLSNMPKGLDELPPGLADIDLSKLKFPGNN